jgi:hypothetical protein
MEGDGGKQGMNNGQGCFMGRRPRALVMVTEVARNQIFLSGRFIQFSSVLSDLAGTSLTSLARTIPVHV